MVPASSWYSITLCTDPLDPNVFTKKQRRAISLNDDKLGDYIQSRINPLPKMTKNGPIRKPFQDWLQSSRAIKNQPIRHLPTTQTLRQTPRLQDPQQPQQQITSSGLVKEKKKYFFPSQYFWVTARLVLWHAVIFQCLFEVKFWQQDILEAEGTVQIFKTSACF